MCWIPEEVYIEKSYIKREKKPALCIRNLKIVERKNAAFKK